MRKKFFLARLLSKENRLSSVEKDAILGTVLRKSVPRRGVQRAVIPIIVATTAALVVALIVWPAARPRVDSVGSELGDEFGARGVPAADALHLSLTCGGHPASRGCAISQTLIFHLAGPATYRYFFALSKRQRAGGEVIWYFPDSADEVGLDLRHNARGGLLNYGVSLESGHAPGHYSVYAVFAKQPRTRREVKAVFSKADVDAAMREAGLLLVKRELRVR